MLKKIALTLLFILISSTAKAQAQSYMIFPNLTAAQAFSAAKCQQMGCDGVNTIYWWAIIGPSPSGQYAVQFESVPRFGNLRGRGDFTAGALNATQQAQLVPFATLMANGWTNITLGQ